MTRRDLQQLARIRLSEAKLLLSAGLPDSAYYLAGYSVECGLKACIAKGTRRFDFPDKGNVDASYTHDLLKLVKVAKLEALHLEQKRNDASFRNNWDLVQQWSEHGHYRRYQNSDATALLEAIGNPKHGVLQWIKQHW